MKMLIPLGVSFDQILHTNIFRHCLDTGMQNEAFASIHLASCDQFAKMLLTLEPHGIF